MESKLAIFDGLPTLSNNEIEIFSKALKSFFGEDYPVEHIDFKENSVSLLNQMAESNISRTPALKIFNNKLLSIESESELYFEEKPLTDFLKWAKEKKLNEHIICISCLFEKIEHLMYLPRLIGMRLGYRFCYNSKNKAHLNNFPYLYQIYVKLLNQDIASLFKHSMNIVKSLIVVDINSNHPEKLLNSFSKIEKLRLNLSYNLDYSKIMLPELENLSTRSPVKLNDLIGTPKLSRISGPIDTREKQYQGPRIKEIHFDLNSTKPVQLENINSENLEFISSWGELSINYGVFLPSVKSIRERSFTNFNELNDFKLSWLVFLPNLITLVIDSRNINFSLDDNWIHTSLLFLSLNRANVEKVDFLNHFPNLTALSLQSNNISNLDPIKQLKHLTRAHLNKNNIIDIPPELSKNFEISTNAHLIGDNARIISIGDNPLISPPIEIIERGERSIKPYFESMLGDIEELNEAKIVFLGNGEVGKTSLMKALIGEKFNAKEKTTHGINIKKYSVPINDKHSVDASIWDFGGQQIMHATHQLFLSRRSVYVLVINDRKEDLQQDQKIEYWLQQVQTYGGDSKVIIVRNKIDEFDVNNLQEGKLKEKFPNLIRVEGVSCAKGTGIDKVRRLINAQVAQLPMRKVKLAKNWIQVKNEIKTLSNEKDHLPLSTFTEICCRNGIHNKEAQTTLRRLLHDLSVIIAFEELVDFDMGILNPHWITDGIYAIINSKTLATNNGYIRLPEVQQELDSAFSEKYIGKARFIIESMMQFELCHPVGSLKSKTYLVPNLLPTEVKNKALSYGANTINFIFRYENLLPPALFPKLLVRLNANISADRRWRTGAVLTDSSLGVQALIEEDSVDREIKITVTGDQVRDFFAYIRQNVRSLNGANAEKLGVQELIPLPDSDGHTVSYNELIGHELDEIAEYYNGSIRKKFSVAQLLSGIESREETFKTLSDRKELTVNVHVETGDNIITNTNTNSQEQTQTATQSQQLDIKLELKGLKGSVENLLEDLRDEAEEEIADLSERNHFVKECNKVEKALKTVENIETEDEANQNLGSFARIKDFLESSLDKTGNIGQAIELLGNNIGRIREIAKKYNKVAGFFGLPTVPEVLL